MAFNSFVWFVSFVGLKSAVGRFLKECKDMLLAIVVIAVGVVIYRSPMLREVALALALGALKLGAAYLGAVLLIAGLRAWRKSVQSADDDRAQMLDYLSRFLPLRFLESVPEFVLGNKKRLEGLREGRTGWLAPAMLLLAITAMGLGGERFVGLPAAAMPAAAALYETQRLVGDEDVINPTLAQIAEANVGPPAGDGVTDALRRVLPVTTTELGDDVRRSLLYPGLSRLGLFLEWTYDIRTARDLSPYVKTTEGATRPQFEQAMAQWTGSGFRKEVLSDLLRLIHPVLFALMWWPAVRKTLGLRTVLGASFHLFAGVTIGAEFAYLVAGAVTMVVIAEAAFYLTVLALFEIWLIAVLPETFRLPPKPTFIVGNLAYGALMGLNFALERWLFA